MKNKLQLAYATGLFLSQTSILTISLLITLTDDFAKTKWRYWWFTGAPVWPLTIVGISWIASCNAYLVGRFASPRIIGDAISRRCRSGILGVGAAAWVLAAAVLGVVMGGKYAEEAYYVSFPIGVGGLVVGGSGCAGGLGWVAAGRAVRRCADIRLKDWRSGDLHPSDDGDQNIGQRVEGLRERLRVVRREQGEFELVVEGARLEWEEAVVRSHRVPGEGTAASLKSAAERDYNIAMGKKLKKFEEAKELQIAIDGMLQPNVRGRFSLGV